MCVTQKPRGLGLNHEVFLWLIENRLRADEPSLTPLGFVSDSLIYVQRNVGDYAVAAQFSGAH